MSQRPTPLSPRSNVWDDPRIVAPDEAAWAALSPAEREAAVEEIVAVLDGSLHAMSEGTPHFRNKSGAAADLDGHFRRAGRRVFLACELALIYPGEPALVPDVSVVMDCDPDLDLGSWVVATRGRGIDVAIEVRNTGAKHKDLVENVRDYARVGMIAASAQRPRRRSSPTRRKPCLSAVVVSRARRAGVHKTSRARPLRRAPRRAR